METIVLVTIAALGILGLVAISALLGGTVLWMIWPVAMNAFPRLAGEGWVDTNLSWWTSVCLVWVFGLLVKSSQTNHNK